MIPSRPLSFIEILTETFSIFGRTFARNALFFVLLVVPGVVLVTIGLTDFTQDTIVSARRDIHLNETTFTALRAEGREWYARNNPLSVAAESTAVVHDPTTRFADSIAVSQKADAKKVEAYLLHTTLKNNSGSLVLLLAGVLLLLIGVFAFTSSSTDLACQVFEERIQEVRATLRSAFVWNVWKMLALYILYSIAAAILNRIFTIFARVSPDVVGAISGIVTIGQIYMAVRCSLTVPALVSEELGPFVALRRSWQLTRLASSRILILSIMFGLILFFLTMFVTILTSIPFGNVFTWLHEFNSAPLLSVSWFLDTFPGFLSGLDAEMSIATLILFPLLPVFVTVFYYDLRTRRDGALVYLVEPS